MWTHALAVAVLFACPLSSWAQATIPIIEAESRVVTITDGLHIKKNFWYVMPERAPDVYYVEIPGQPHTVTFTTDHGSIAFPVTFGSRHQFNIRLADGRMALTEIRAEFRELLTPAQSSVDTRLIPFVRGDNDKLYVKGRINGGPELDFQLDLGAGGTLIKKGSIGASNMTFDGTITLRNSDGDHATPSSSANTLDIAGFHWTSVPIAVAGNMTPREDGLLGNSLFRDRVLEIDNDRMVIVVHDALPRLSPEWTREDVILDGGTVPFIRGRLAVNDDLRDGWFMLDTGAYTSILNSRRLSKTTKFAGEVRRLLGPLGGHRSGPILSIGGTSVSDTNYSVRAYDGDDSALGLLGADVLKRFNIVLDNQHGVAFLRPSARMTDVYRNPERLVVRTALLVTGAMGAAIVWWRRTH
jgi:hypothetical protein